MKYTVSIIIICILPLLCRYNVLAEKIPGINSVTLTSQTGFYEQEYHIADEMPRKIIQTNWDKGKHITALAQGNGLWTVVMSSHTNFGGQSYTVSDTLPYRFIEEMWDKGFRITSLDFGNGVWTLVMSQTGGILQQIVCVDDTIPTQTIRLWRSKGYVINTIAKGNGTWVTSFNSATWFMYEQPIFISDTFPRFQIDRALKSGMRMQSIQNYGTWIIVLNSISRSRSQIVLTDTLLTKERIRSLLDSGYRITHVSAEKSPSELGFISSRKPNPMVLQSLDLTQNPTDETIGLFRKYIQRNAPRFEAILALQKLLQKDIQKEDWKAAADTCLSYRKYFRDSTSYIDALIDLLTRNEPIISVVNAGDSLNSTANEWDPNPTPDGKYFYQSTSGKSGGYGAEDVFISERLPNGKWSLSKNIGKSINTRNLQETIDNISTDNNTLYLSGEFPGTFGKFDIFTSERTEEGWSALRQMPKPINSEHHDESGCPTPDGKAILFTSDRPGAIGNFVPKQGYILNGTTWGNSDIYICIKTDSGWSAPINLGKTINTPYAETSVFLHPDGRTLYFSSNGHAGLGGLDMFKSVRLKEDSWTEWSTPINLGRQLNGVSDDWGFHASVNTDTAYFAARDRKGGKGGWDIWTVKLNEQLRPLYVTSIRGKVTDESGNPLSARIKWEDLNTGKVIGELSSNPQDGSYYIALPLGKLYGFFADKEGFYPTAKNIDVRTIKEGKDSTVNIQLISLQNIRSGKTSVVINNIFFDFDAWDIKEESYPELERLIQLMNKEKELRIEIGGHTDDKGSVSYNNTLSKNRAEAVKSYLLAHGIETKRLLTKGYGKSKPLNKLESEQERAKNRRVEFRVVKKK